MKLLLSGAALAAAATPAYGQSTWFVDASAAGPGTGSVNDPYASIQVAIDAPTTLAGDTLMIGGGTYAETIDLTGKDLILDGAGTTPPAVIDAQGFGTALTLTNGESSACVIRGLIITGGTGTNSGTAFFGGGALLSGASPTFEGVTFEGNQADRGGGVAISGGAPTFQDCVFRTNASRGGGGLYAEGSASLAIVGGSLDDNFVDGQSASGFGGGVFLDDGVSATITGATFSRNQTLSFGGGGGLYVATGASADVVGCDFIENVPGLFVGPGSGGGIYARGDVDCSLSTFIGNGSFEPDGVFGGGGARGGTYTACVFDGNWGQLGGGIRSATAIDCEFTGNVGCADGGGQGGAAHSSTLINCVLARNFTCGEGGGAYQGSLEGCAVIENTAFESDGGQSQGGGLHSADASDTLLRGNATSPINSFSPPSVGGGAFLCDLDRCIVIGNRAVLGGGVVGGSATQTSIIGNFAETSNPGTLDGQYDSSIVWHNFPPAMPNNGSFTYSNVAGGVPAGTGNLSMDPALIEPSGADVHLLAGSPCIDSGSPSLPADADGTPADMGALPFDPAWLTAPASFCRSTPTNQGCRVELVAVGAASLTTGLDFQADHAPPLSFGLFFLGTEPNHQLVPSPVTSLPNTLCVRGTVSRAVVVQSSPSQDPCGGTFAGSVSPAELLGAGAQIGGALYGQLWFRDPVTSGSRTAMSSGVYLPIAP